MWSEVIEDYMMDWIMWMDGSKEYIFSFSFPFFLFSILMAFLCMNCIVFFLDLFQKRTFGTDFFYRPEHMTFLISNIQCQSYTVSKHWNKLKALSLTESSSHRYPLLDFQRIDIVLFTLALWHNYHPWESTGKKWSTFACHYYDQRVFHALYLLLISL